MFKTILRFSQAIFAIFVLSAVGAQAAILIVDNTTDDAALSACTFAGEDCSLRGAIAAAAAGDTITFDVGVFMSPRTIAIAGDELLIDKNLTITGTGSNKLTLSGVTYNSGVLISRYKSIFRVAANSVAISGMTITKGDYNGVHNLGALTLTDVSVVNNISYGGGGGIYNDGTLTLNNCIVSGNKTEIYQGGGIMNYGSLNVINSTISDNYSGSEGGGIYNDGMALISGSVIAGNYAFAGGGLSGTSMTITNSAIINNTAAGYSGGIYGGWCNSPFNISNSTISGNKSLYGGAGFYGSGRLTNVTITNNTATSEPGGGIKSCGDSLNIRNSIIAGNNAPSNNDVSGAFVSQGNNIVQNRGTSAGYIVSDLPNGTNPLLASLSNNGGLGATHALLVGSPAINAGNNAYAVGTTDQRGIGFTRIARGKIDIGAFEFK
jgi:predicted outer membrane repeat protein